MPANVGEPRSTRSGPWMSVTVIALCWASSIFLLNAFAGSDSSVRYFLSAGIASSIAAGALCCRLWRSMHERLTELKRLVSQMEAARRQAEAANAAKSRFLATMSHEIRTPMSGVIGMNSLLLETELTAEQRSYASAIDSSGRALLSIIDEILDTSKIEAGKVTFDLKPFALIEMIEGVSELLAPRAHAKGIEVASYVSRELPPLVVGDANRLRQVLLNLMGNAIKFTEYGGVILSVEPAPPGADSGLHPVKFEITDSGIGISPADHQRIFEMFAQARDADAERYGGTGLGLAISRDLVHRMGGEIECSSNPGQGATFSFTLAFKSASEGASPAAPPLTGRMVTLAMPRGPTKTALVRTLTDLGASVNELGPDYETGALLRAISQGGNRLHHVIVDACLAHELQNWLASLPQGKLSKSFVWLLLQPEERRRYPMVTEARTGYLLKPLRQSTLIRQFVEGDMLHLSHAVEQLRKSASTRPGAGAALNVLLVEDNPVNARLTIAMLVKAGHLVAHMASGEEAVAEVRAALACGSGSTRLPDLILMDVRMPGISGLEAARRIRREEAAHGAVPRPILALTANARDEDYENCMASGMNGFLAKPFDRADLEEAIARVARRTAA
jgi:signal transduction histidine kinase/AmiR/NasT family two-component response regulator